MVKRNPNLAKLSSGYLFPEINRRKADFLARNPSAKLISLGIGDTTEPIPPYIIKGLKNGAEQLGTSEGYRGYGPEQGDPSLRRKVAEQLYHNRVSASEVYISDGAKCDIGRLQLLFGQDVTVAIQDPSYPVYVDSGVIMGQTGLYDSKQGGYKKIVYMPCTPENHFFPDLNDLPRTDLIYFCSPNNPTGATATKEQLNRLVGYAKANRSILIYDAAYSMYIQDPKLPKTIFDIEGSRDVALELGSFSKMSGFTGVRLGWSVIPEQLTFDDGTPVKNDWNRIQTTIFNGASNIAQIGGIAVLEEEGVKETTTLINFYMENARILKKTIEELGYSCYGGENTPFLWVYFPKHRSWDIFELLLTKAQIVTTPGSGFGPAGEGFLRLSAFGHRENILEAASRLKTALM